MEDEIIRCGNCKATIGDVYSEDAIKLTFHTLELVKGIDEEVSDWVYACDTDCATEILEERA